MKLNHPVLFFDGVCNLCNASVQRVIKADPQAIFRFAALQSDTAKVLLADTPLRAADLKSVILWHRGKYYTQSDAILETARLLGGAWQLLYLFKVVPQWIRNPIYDWIARNRYRWFGQQATCMVPSSDLKNRFL
jgi:predicted DCC family thiol-disulfide oxidoreductase YuxK